MPAEKSRHPVATGASILRMEPAAAARAAAAANPTIFNGGAKSSRWDAIPTARKPGDRWSASGLPTFPWDKVNGTPENQKKDPRRDNPWSR